MKTISLKKVSAVAVASLGFGLLSVVPAQAALSTADAVTSISLAKVTTTPTVGTAVAVNFGAVMAADWEGTTRFVATLETYPAGGNVSVLGVIDANGATELGASDAITTGGVVVTDPTVALGVTASATAGNASFQFTPTKAGTYNLVVWNDAGTSPDGILTALEVRQSISLTVVAAATYSNTLSTAFMRVGVTDVVGDTPDATSDAAGASNTATKGGVDATNDTAAAINVLIKNSSNGVMASGNTMAAEISGPGYLFWQNAAVGANKCLVSPNFATAGTGRSLSALAIDDDTYLYVCADGTPGVASIKITITDAAGTATVLATKTVTFFGAVTKIAATGVLTVAASGGATLGDPTANRSTSAMTPAIIVKATDSANNPVSGLTFTYKSSSTAVMAETLTCNEDIKSAANVKSSGGAGFYNCRVTSSTGSKSGDKATLTVRTVDPADSTLFLTSDVAFTIGGSATTGTETIAFDKTSYAPGEAMVITRTAKDSAGNPVADFTASPTYSFSKAAGGAAPAAGVYVGGKSATSTSAATAGIFAPSVPGSFTVTATAANGATITATATVTDANAGLLTQIDALNAKIVALNALIAKIMKKLGVK